MSTPLAELAAEFGNRDDQPATARDLLRVMRLLMQAADTLRSHREFIAALEERLLLVDDLPVEAPFGALIRLRTGPAAGRVPVYVGNGAGQPLSKLTPTPL